MRPADGDQWQQVVVTVCRMFAGPYLVHDFRRLGALGAGTLVIDLTTGTCLHEKRHVAPLAVVQRLRAWLRQNLPTVPASASLEVTLRFAEYEGPRNQKVQWAGEHTGFIGCAMTITGKMAIDQAVYEAEHCCTVEWPRDLSF